MGTGGDTTQPMSDPKIGIPVCLALLPYSIEKDHPVRDAIEAAASEAGFNVLLPERLAVPGDIFSHLTRLVNEADVVVADITGNNPNVFFELGMRFALGKPLLTLTQGIEQIPFDIASHRVIAYRNSPDGLLLLRRTLRRALDLIREESAVPMPHGAQEAFTVTQAIRRADALLETGRAGDAIKLLNELSVRAEKERNVAATSALLHFAHARTRARLTNGLTMHPPLADKYECGNSVLVAAR